MCVHILRQALADVDVSELRAGRVPDCPLDKKPLHKKASALLGAGEQSSGSTDKDMEKTKTFVDIEEAYIEAWCASPWLADYNFLGYVCACVRSMYVCMYVCMRIWTRLCACIFRCMQASLSHGAVFFYHAASLTRPSAACSASVSALTCTHMPTGGARARRQ
jgi:hypothetical protein